MSSFNNHNQFDNLLMQTLMGGGRLRQPPPPPPAFLNQSLEDILLETLTNSLNLSDSDSDDAYDENGVVSTKTQLAKEESKLEKEIIKKILSGDLDSLKPNSGQAVSIGEHHICVGFHVEDGSDYRVWEWHGHVMLFDEEDGYTPEYVYGNYFERMKANVKAGKKKDKEKEVVKEKEEGVGNSGLKELIGTTESGNGRILHRNLNAGSCLQGSG